MVYVDNVVAYADATNVSFQASSHVAPVVAPAVERVDPSPVIPGAGALAVCSTYERWRDEEDSLLLGGSTQILKAVIFDAEDSLAAELRLCCLRSFLVRCVADNLMAAFDAFGASQAESIV